MSLERRRPQDFSHAAGFLAALVGEVVRRGDEALPELQKCAQLMPRSPDVQSSLGQVYLELIQS